MRLGRLLFSCLITGGLVLSGKSTFVAHADEPDKTKLEEIRVQMADAEASVAKLTDSVTAIKNDLVKLNSQVSSLKDREKKLRKEFDKKQSTQLEIQKLVQDLQGRLLELELRVEARTKALYLLHVAQPSGALLTKGYEAFSRGTVYLKSIKKMDAQEAEEIKTLRGRRDLETGKLQQNLKESQALLADVEIQRKQIESTISSQAKKMSDLQSQKKSLEGALLSLRAQELRLETVLKSLTGGDEPTVTDSKRNITEGSSDRESVAWEGPGLKGVLVNPLKGKLSKKFGEGEGVTKKGIIIKGSGSGSVLAVAEGKVAYVGSLPQLGNVVIIDHGSRDFSLYGKLSQVSAALGSIIPSGGAIGEPEETFYFEIRKKGVSVNPLLNRYGSR